MRWEDTMNGEQAQIRPKDLNDDDGLTEGTGQNCPGLAGNQEKLVAISDIFAEVRTGFHHNTRMKRSHYTIYSVRRRKCYNYQYHS
jgi:hypothetical protein